MLSYELNLSHNFEVIFMVNMLGIYEVIRDQL
jgi:hypothetical protein